MENNSIEKEELTKENTGLWFNLAKKIPYIKDPLTAFKARALVEARSIEEWTERQSRMAWAICNKIRLTEEQLYQGWLAVACEQEGAPLPCDTRNPPWWKDTSQEAQSRRGVKSGKVRRWKNRKRDEQIVRWITKNKFSIKQVAAHVKLHASTICRIVSRDVPNRKNGFFKPRVIKDIISPKSQNSDFKNSDTLPEPIVTINNSIYLGDNKPSLDCEQGSELCSVLDSEKEVADLKHNKSPP